MNEMTLVFRDPVIAAEERREKFSLLAWQNDWEIYNIQKRSNGKPYTMTYMTQDEKTGINYIENDVVDIPYIVIRGENQEKIAEILSTSLNFYSIHELIDFVDSNPEDEGQLSRVILLLGTGLKGDFNADFFDKFKFCLTHPSPEVRKAAMLASASLGWSEFRPILEDIRKDDSNLDVRSYAETTIKNLQAYVWSS
jgi:hypothetical protein